ncbi:hypothetical protein [Actinoplanes sp. NPDC026623]|uniref:hypothetical protein n=1 Tax=Actinoplanes sp. NPDC026623 TaxID=3155610 RepID=UPI00340E87D5
MSRENRAMPCAGLGTVNNLAGTATTPADQIRAVFGENFPVVPAFAAADPDLLHPSGAGLLGGDTSALLTWATRTARVRAGVARAVAALTYAEAMATGEALTLGVAQVPYAAGDSWAGLPRTAATPAGSRLSLVVHAAPGATFGSAAGLVLDEWTEVVPNTRETTAVAYHFDTPSATAPQAVLVAVPPDDRPVWSLDLIERTLLEAMDLARLRLVDFEALHPIDPDALTDIGQFLPAAYFAANPAGDVPSTVFTEGR